MRSCLSRYNQASGNARSSRAGGPATQAGASSGPARLPAAAALAESTSDASRRPGGRQPGRQNAGRLAASQAATKRQAYLVARLRRSLV